MRWLRFILILAPVTILNASRLMDSITVSELRIRPDLLIIMLAFFSLNCPIIPAMICSFVIGLASDVSSPVMGPGVLAFGIVGTVTAHIREAVITKSIPHQFIAVFLVSLLAGAGVYFFSFVKTEHSSPNFYSALLAGSLYTALLGPAVWRLLHLLRGWFGIRKYRIGRFDSGR